MNQSKFSRKKFLTVTTLGFASTVILKGCKLNSSEQTTNPSSTSTSEPKSSDNIAVNSEEALYEAAKKEGKFTWYAVYFNQEIVDEIGKLFTSKYPEIQVEGIRNTASVLFQKLTQETQAGLKIADVFATTDISQMMQLKSEQKLQQYKPLGKENIIEKYRNLEPENYYQVGAYLPIIIGYNSELISTAEAPSSWQKLVESKYKDKIATGSGFSSGQVGVWALSMEQKYGWDYLVKFNQLAPKLSSSINDVVPALVSQEKALGVTTVGQVLERKAVGDPIEVIYPEDETVVVVAPVGILKEAPNPNAAKLFLNFLNSPEYSQLIAKHFEQPINSGVKLETAKSFTEVPIYTPQATEIQANILKTKEKWLEEFGA
jgi:iron(III) transport system substrate-binding protein